MTDLICTAQLPTYAPFENTDSTADHDRRGAIPTESAMCRTTYYHELTEFITHPANANDTRPHTPHTLVGMKHTL